MSWERFRQKKHHRYKAVSKSINERHCPRCMSGKDANDRNGRADLSNSLRKGIPIRFANSRFKLGKAYGICARAAAMAFTGYQFLCQKHKGFVFTQKMNHLDMWY